MSYIVYLLLLILGFISCAIICAVIIDAAGMLRDRIRRANRKRVGAGK